MDYVELSPQGIDPEEARSLMVKADGRRWWPTFAAAASALLNTNLVSPDETLAVEHARSFQRWKAMIDDPELARGDGGGQYATVDLVEVVSLPDGVRAQTGWETAITRYESENHGPTYPGDELGETIADLDPPNEDD
jgi:hypothetical protein